VTILTRALCRWSEVSTRCRKAVGSSGSGASSVERAGASSVQSVFACAGRSVTKTLWGRVRLSAVTTYQLGDALEGKHERQLSGPTSPVNSGGHTAKHTVQVPAKHTVQVPQACLCKTCVLCVWHHQ
jgi:hypothetical protein